MRAMLDSISKRLFLVVTTVMLMVTVTSVHAAEFSLEKFGADNAIWFGLLFVVVEYILGKTEVVKSGSTLELVINTVVGLIKKFIGSDKSSLKGLK